MLEKIDLSKTLDKKEYKKEKIEREVKYKARLDKMESLTMIMLVCTGCGVMIIILFAMLQMFNY